MWMLKIFIKSTGHKNSKSTSAMLLTLELLVFFLVITSDGQSRSRPESEIPGPPGSTPAPEPVVHPEDEAAMKACRDRISHTSPDVVGRFSESTITATCSRNAWWQRAVVNANESQASTHRPNFTDAQLIWLQSVFKCDDVNCICERSKTCGNSSRRHFQRVRSKRQRFPVDDSLPSRDGRAVRMEIRQMSDSDRWRYFRAVQNLKGDFIDGMSKYDILVRYHTPEFGPEAHFSAAFLPYHREMMKNLEVALRMVDPGVSLPYWDTTVDAPLPNPTDSVVWTSDFFGNGFGDVMDGPFANWPVLPDRQFGTLSRSGRLTRSLGRRGSLIDEGDVSVIMGKPRYRNLVFCNDPFMELAHGATHMWVGGHMFQLRMSPNDPVFYSLHSFIDLIWENWRWRHQGYQQRESEYSEPCNGVGRFNAQMRPYQMSNADGLSNRYTEVFYSYSNRPFCPDCGGTQYLFCDTRWNKCVSKIRLGGFCRGFERFDSCANGQCVNGRCVSGQPPATISNSVTGGSTQQTSGCQNDHACCRHWANGGECDRNQAWMRSNCRAACRICSGNSGGCVDTNSGCVRWASNGECSSNSAWMSIGCPVSCNTCNSDTAGNACDAGGGSNSVQRDDSCRNIDDRCPDWARSGECTRNPSWMNPNCARACNSCR